MLERFIMCSLALLTVSVDVEANHRSEAIGNGQVKHNIKDLTNVHTFNSYNVYALAVIY